jgi:protein tyrosine phosphatase
VERDSELVELGITRKDAADIVNILAKAYSNNQNVLVHCNAGLCRSGAVTEIGTVMGFTDLKKPRIPNSMVKYFLLLELGLTYEDDEETK